MMEEAVITGIAHDTSEVKLTIRGVPDATGIAATVFSALAAIAAMPAPGKVILLVEANLK